MKRSCTKQIDLQTNIQVPAQSGKYLKVTWNIEKSAKLKLPAEEDMNRERKGGDGGRERGGWREGEGGWREGEGGKGGGEREGRRRWGGGGGRSEGGGVELASERERASERD